jgi:spore coat polysaccharide biosynthesis protein SpsF
MKKVVALVQARMGSNRLPGKSMLPLAGKPLIEHVLRRVARSRTVHQLVLATTPALWDDILCREASRLGVEFFRGPEDDVLDRFFQAAKATRAEVVVRVCADNPLIAPEEIDRLVQCHLASGADYSFNHIPAMANGYPDGLGAEAMEFSALARLHHLARESRHREHVTLYIWDHLEDFRVETIPAPPDIAGQDIKLDVDTAADLARLEVLLQDAPGAPEDWPAADLVLAYRARFGGKDSG